MKRKQEEPRHFSAVHKGSYAPTSGIVDEKIEQDLRERRERKENEDKKYMRELRGLEQEAKENAEIAREEAERKEKKDLPVWILKKIAVILLLLLPMIFLSGYHLCLMTPKGMDNEYCVVANQSVYSKLPKIFPDPKNCSDTLVHSQCLNTTPMRCEDGKLVFRPDMCICPLDYRVYDKTCILNVSCSDGTLEPECSQNKSFQCINGTLIENAVKCGCPADFSPNGAVCEKNQYCTDGTIYGQCSVHKPLYCLNGSLRNRASVCGCPDGMNIQSMNNQNTEQCVETQNAYQNNAIPTGSNSASQSAYDINSLETKIHNQINVRRVQNNLPALTLDPKLSSIARSHSLDMVARNFFSHDNPAGQDATARGVAVGYTCTKSFGSYYLTGIAENIFQTWTFTHTTYSGGIPISKSYQTEDQMAMQIVDGWMDSPGHRQNILTSTYDREGIGVAISSAGEVLVTEDFC